MTTPAAPRRTRETILGAIPRWYSGALHFAAINAVTVAVILLAVRRLERPTAGELLFVPAFFVFANYFEWRIHRGPMHHRTRGLELLFRRHTLEHHVVFTEGDLAIRRGRDLKLVLFPPLFLPLMLLLTAPVPLALGLLVSPNLGWLFLASSVSYYLVYEWFHLVHHLPERGLAATRVARRLRAHHGRHHAPGRMTEGNFNVSFPLWDWLLGTRLR